MEVLQLNTKPVKSNIGQSLAKYESGAKVYKDG